MKTKLSLLMTTVVLAAFAAPAFASAHVLTMPPGTLVPTGTRFILTSTNLTVQISVGITKCEHFEITGEVTSNSGGAWTGIGVGPGSAKTCTVSGKVAAATDITLSSISANGSGTTLAITWKDHIGGVECHFVGTAVPFTYVSGTDVIKITNANLQATPAATCEPATLNAEFTVTTDPATLGVIILD